MQFGAREQSTRPPVSAAKRAVGSHGGRHLDRNGSSPGSLSHGESSDVLPWMKTRHSKKCPRNVRCHASPSRQYHDKSMLTAAAPAAGFGVSTSQGPCPPPPLFSSCWRHLPPACKALPPLPQPGLACLTINTTAARSPPSFQPASQPASPDSLCGEMHKSVAASCQSCGYRQHGGYVV